MKSESFRHSQKVSNVVPGDYTQDGKLDILVMGQDRASNQLSLQVYVALPQGGFSTSQYFYARPINLTAVSCRP